jgi:hypothetical protein
MRVGEQLLLCKIKQKWYENSYYTGSKLNVGVYENSYYTRSNKIGRRSVTTQDQTSMGVGEQLLHKIKQNWYENNSYMYYTGSKLNGGRRTITTQDQSSTGVSDKLLRKKIKSQCR